MGRLTDPPFARLAVVGLGLIGGSVALAAKRRWPAVHVTGIDRPAVIDAALAMGAADAGGDRLELAAEADLVLLAAPVLQNVAALTSLAPHVRPDAVITDVGSTKRAMARAADALPGGTVFIGGHPLAGAAVSGLDAARPDLFEDRPWILTGADRAPAPAAEALTRFVLGLRGVPHRMDAAEHDHLLAYVSHLPQLAVSALMHVVGGHAGPAGLALAGRGLRDTTRLASSPAQTWRDIVATNGDNIALALADLIAVLEHLGPSPGEASTAVEEVFVSAARWKGVLDHS